MQRAHSFHIGYWVKKNTCNMANPNLMKWQALICGPARDRVDSDGRKWRTYGRICESTTIVSFLLRYHKVKRWLFYASRGQTMSRNIVFYLQCPRVEVSKTVFSIAHPNTSACSCGYTVPSAPVGILITPWSPSKQPLITYICFIKYLSAPSNKEKYM